MAERYEVVKSVKGYYTSADARDSRDAKCTVSPGSYYIFNRYNGCVNVTTQPGCPGFWINPSENTGSTSNPIQQINDTINNAISQITQTINGVATNGIPSSAKMFKTNAFGEKVARGYIVREDNGSILSFQFNPDSWQRSHKALYTSPDSPGSAYPEVNYIRQDKRSVILKVSYDIRVDKKICSDIPSIIKEYENLTQPSPFFVIMQRGSKKFVAPPTCKFIFGKSIIKCKIAEVKIARTAFDKKLEPIACQIEIEVLEVV